MRTGAWSMSPSVRSAASPSTAIGLKSLWKSHGPINSVSCADVSLGKMDDSLYENRAKLKIAYFNVSMHLAPRWRTSIFRQIDALLSAEDWDDDCSEISCKSFATFLKFLIFSGPSKIPSLGVGPTGNLLAGWENVEHLVSVEFLPDDKAHALVSKVTERGQEVASWRGPVARLMNFIELFSSVNCLK